MTFVVNVFALTILKPKYLLLRAYFESIKHLCFPFPNPLSKMCPCVCEPGDGGPPVSGPGDLHGVRGPRGPAALQPLLRHQVLPVLADPGGGGGAGLVPGGQGGHHRLVRLLPPPQRGAATPDQGKCRPLSRATKS